MLNRIGRVTAVVGIASMAGLTGGVLAEASLLIILSFWVLLVCIAVLVAVLVAAVSRVPVGRTLDYLGWRRSN